MPFISCLHFDYVAELSSCLF